MIRPACIAILLWLPTLCGVQAQDQSVLSLQASLHFLGYDVGNLSGSYDRQTRYAVEAFEFSVGMGDEGVLNEGELALLRAQVAAEAYEKFGYRLVGYWSPLPCEDDAGRTRGIWFEDLAWIASEDQRYSLIETELSNPLRIEWEDRTESISSPYFTVLGTGADIRFFPLEDRMLVIAGGQVFSLNHCETNLDDWSDASENALIQLN